MLIILNKEIFIRLIAKKTMFVGSSSFSMERWFSIQGRIGFYEDIHTKQRRARLYWNKAFHSLWNEFLL